MDLNKMDAVKFLQDIGKKDNLEDYFSEFSDDRSIRLFGPWQEKIRREILS